MNHHPALAVTGLAHTYGEGPGAVDALVGIDLAFARGTFTAVMGPSGSGKSTFLACVAGLERPTSGHVLIEGADVTHWAEARRTRMRRDRIGFVFQDFSLIPYLTAAENVALPPRLSGRRAQPEPIRTAAGPGGAREPGRAPAGCPFGRPAAARRRRPGARHRTRRAAGRRADGRARQRDRARGAAAARGCRRRPGARRR